MVMSCVRSCFSTRFYVFSTASRIFFCPAVPVGKKWRSTFLLVGTNLPFCAVIRMTKETDSTRSVCILQQFNFNSMASEHSVRVDGKGHMRNGMKRHGVTSSSRTVSPHHPVGPSKAPHTCLCHLRPKEPWRMCAGAMANIKSLIITTSNFNNNK